MSCLSSSSSSSSINHVQFNSDLLNSLSSSMDWQAWLSKTLLHPSLAREYAGLFSDNLLEKEDIEHFDHEFLLSMGIVVGKHRLEILKLARKKTGLSSMMNKFGGRVKNYVRTVAQSGGSAIVAFPKVAGRYYWASNGMSRRKGVMGKEERLMITNGKEGGGGNEGVRWDYMFQDLKPT